MSYRIVAIVGAVLALCITSGLALAQVEKPKLTLAVGGKNTLYYLPLNVAERQGYFKDEGLAVEIVDFAGGAKALQALVGGSADVVSGAYEHTINMQAKSQPIKAFVIQGRHSNIVLALSKAKAASYKSPKDLKGLKIGVTAPGSSTNMFVNNLLAKDGLKPSDVSIIGVGAGAGAVAAMKKGEIDAMSNIDPVSAQVERDGDAVVVAESRTAEGMKKHYGGAYAAACLYAPEEFVAKNPKTTQALANAIVRALKWMAKSSPEQIAAILPPEFIGPDRALFMDALGKSLEGYSRDGQMTMDAAKNVYNVLVQFEPSVMAAKDKIELAKTFDNAFAVKANENYK